MGLFENYQFDGYGGQSNGLLDVLRMMQSVPNQPPGFDLQNNQPSPLDTAQYPAGPMGAPSELPPNAQPTQGQFSQSQPPMGGLGDHFGAGLKSFIGNLHGGPIAALAGGLGGLVTGERNDPHGEIIKQQNLTVRALIARGVNPNDAVLAASNPDMMKALLPRLWPTLTAHNVGDTATAFNPASGEFKPGYTATKVEKIQPGESLVTISGQPGQQRTATPISGLPAPQAKFDDVSSMRKEITALPEVKRYTEAAPIFRSMVQSSALDSAAADLDFVYGVAKIFDPDSVVREGEMKLVGKAQSIPEDVKGFIKRAAMGEGRLTLEARQRILEVAHTRMNELRGSYDQRVNPYSEIAKRHNIRPDDVLPSVVDLPKMSPIQAEAPKMQDGATATHPKTGTKIIMRDGKWVPLR